VLLAPAGPWCLHFSTLGSVTPLHWHERNKQRESSSMNGRRER
jgi:hypothetical protein